MNGPVALAMIVLGVVNLGGLVLLWLHIDRRGEDTRALGDRVSRLETNISYLPKHRELTEIRTALGQLSSSVAALTERSEATSDMLRAIQTHLMDNAR